MQAKGWSLENQPKIREKEKRKKGIKKNPRTMHMHCEGETDVQIKCR